MSWPVWPTHGVCELIDRKGQRRPRRTDKILHANIPAARVRQLVIAERLPRLCGAGAPFRPLFLNPVPSFLFRGGKTSFSPPGPKASRQPGKYRQNNNSCQHDTAVKIKEKMSACPRSRYPHPSCRSAWPSSLGRIRFPNRAGWSIVLVPKVIRRPHPNESVEFPYPADNKVLLLNRGQPRFASKTEARHRLPGSRLGINPLTR